MGQSAKGSPVGSSGRGGVVDCNDGDGVAMQHEWWRQEGAKEIHRGESDGQRFTCVFVRSVGSQIEYAVVECSDGDYLDYVFGGFTLKGETVTPIKVDA